MQVKLQFCKKIFNFTCMRSMGTPIYAGKSDVFWGGPVLLPGKTSKKTLKNRRRMADTIWRVGHFASTPPKPPGEETKQEPSPSRAFENNRFLKPLDFLTELSQSGGH